MLRKDELKPINKTSTATPEEIDRFNALAEEWWRPDGKFKVVHAFNACRVNYLCRHISEVFGRNPQSGMPLDGLKIADIGCGAGLVSEPIARLGARVTAIDAAERNIEIARRHAEAEGISIAYRHATPDQLSDQHGEFDLVLSLEVVEHVADLDAFLVDIAELVRPGGTLIIGTLNRTPKSFAFGIVGAEYILGLLPKGTHQWSKFVTPEEIDRKLRQRGFRSGACVGVSMNPVTWRWSISNDLNVNYLKTLHRSVSGKAK